MDGLPAGFESNFSWLIGQVFHAHVTESQRALEDFPASQRGYMVVQAAVSGCARNQLEMSKILGLDRTVMVYLVDELVKAGLVERVPDPADRRNRLIVATEEGRARLLDATERVAQVDERLLAPLQGADRERFREMLRQLVGHRHDDPHAACARAAAIADSGK